MKLFYLDESGNPELTGPSESYVLTAISIPVEKWLYCDRDEKAPYAGNAEIQYIIKHPAR